MSAQRGAYDSGYDPKSRCVQRCIDELRRRGHEIGFHAGYRAIDDPARFMAEKKSMKIFLGGIQFGGRQHFLRLRVPNTWRLWEQAGLSYDYSLGYANHERFRCVTRHPFRPFDAEHNRELKLSIRLARPLN